MRKLIYLILIIITLFSSACSNNVLSNSDDEIIKEENLNIIPYKDRKFIYTNNIMIERKEESTDDNGTKTNKYYDQISGLINEDVQNKINNSIVETLDSLLINAENKILNSNSKEKVKFTDKSYNTYVNYNCNNVIFINYYAYIYYTIGNESNYAEVYKSEGYDLNTGHKLELKDLFISGLDYEKLINEQISLFIISNNIDDPDSYCISKPFQGIHENQGFTFDTSGLHIIIDEKNEEFINSFNFENTITIQLKDIGEYLAIFDRYFKEDTNIYLTEKRYKKLLPNDIEYIVDSYESEYGLYDIRIIEGHFVNLNNPELEEKIKELSQTVLGKDEFVKRAKEYELKNPNMYYGFFDHNLVTYLNSGGYLSVCITDTTYELENQENFMRFVNYDFNNNKYLKLGNLFRDEFNYKFAIADYISHNYGYINTTISSITSDMISEENFNFNEDSVFIKLNLDKKETHVEDFWIPYEEIGLDNIAFLTEN